MKIEVTRVILPPLYLRREPGLQHQPADASHIRDLKKLLAQQPGRAGMINGGTEKQSSLAVAMKNAPKNIAYGIHGCPNPITPRGSFMASMADDFAWCGSMSCR